MSASENRSLSLDDREINVAPVSASVISEQNAAVSRKLQRLAILVLGMHRSGTSAISGVLNFLGASIPGDLLPPSEDNKKGFFENRRIVEFHERLLKEFGSRWDDPLPLSTSSLQSLASRGAARELSALLQEEFADQALVLIKDPRMCRLLPVWLQALAYGERDAVAILPVRHPLEVAASLRLRDAIPRAHGLVLWLQHVLEAEQATRSVTRCFVSYENLLLDWRSTVSKISEEVGLSWPKDSIRAADAIDEFLSTELRHHRAAGEGGATQDALHRLSLRAWCAVKTLCIDNKCPSALAALDQVAEEFNQATDVLSPLVVSLDTGLLSTRQQLIDRDRLFANLGETLGERDKRIADLKETLAARDAVAQHLQDEATRRSGEAEALRAEVAQRQSAAEQLRDELEQRGAEVERLRAELTDQRAAAVRLRRELAQRRSEVDAATVARMALAEQQVDELRLRAEQAEARQERIEAERIDAVALADQLANALDLARAERDSVLQSTAWQVTWPARSIGRHLPQPVRRAVRGTAKIGWWTLTLKLPRKLRQRQEMLRPNRRVTDVLMPSPEPPTMPPSLEHHPKREGPESLVCTRDREKIQERIAASGLFDPEVYLSLHSDLRQDEVDAWQHYVDSGINERRHFTNCEAVAKAIADLDEDLQLAANEFQKAAEVAFAKNDEDPVAALFRRHNIRIAIFCSSVGNFFMREIADALGWGLQEQGIAAIHCDEYTSMDEPFDLRIFVAPHEFFWLGEGRKWIGQAGAKNSVLYNVEQMQTQWFCRAFPLLLAAPLVMDINFQTTEILRRAGCRAVHFMPGHMLNSPHCQPCIDVSDIGLLKGYPFRHQPFNWLEQNRLADRPIDILFIGSAADRRDRILPRLQYLCDKFRFMCVYTRQDAPLTQLNNRATSTEINCALAQRAKIVLNIHRDWLGYFEWSRMVLQGFWQGACVVGDPGLRNPIFVPGVHYLEEHARNIGEMICWLLETGEGSQKLDETRRAAYEHASTLGSMRVSLAPVLGSFSELLRI